MCNSDLVYKVTRIIADLSFPVQLKRKSIRCKRVGYKMDIMRGSREFCKRGPSLAFFFFLSLFS